MEYGYGKNFGYSWDYLSCIEMTIELEINAIRKIIDSNEKVINEINADFKKKIQEDADLIGINDRHYESYVYSQKYMYDEFLNSEIVSQQINSICFTIFSVFENNLTEICEKIKNEFNIDENFKKEEGENDLERRFNYLEKRSKLPLDSIKPSFEKLNEQKFARNKLYHNNGKVSEENKKKLKIVDGLMFKKETNLIVIRTDYLNYLLTNMEDFFIKLIPLIDEKYKEWRKNGG